MTDKEILDRITELLPRPSDVDEVRQKLQARLDWIAEVASAIQVLSNRPLKAQEYADTIKWFAECIVINATARDSFIAAHAEDDEKILSEARSFLPKVG